MEKLVETLIGRLEELRKLEVDMIGGYCQSTISKAIKIVNQLAEEFDSEELRKSQKIYSFIKREINPYGKPFEGTVYEFGLKVMKFIKNIHIEEFATDINVVSNNGWIPVSERLPSVGVTVLCYWKQYDRYDNTTNYYYSLMHRNEDSQWLSDFGMCSGEVIAWQPLPAPYEYEEKINDN